MLVPSCPTGEPRSRHWGFCRARLCPCCAPLPPSTGGVPRGPGSIPVGPPGSFSQIRCVPPRPTPPSAPLRPSWCPPPIHPCAPLIPGAAESGVGGLPGAPPQLRAGTPTPQTTTGMPRLRWARPDPGISGSVLEVGDKPSFHGGDTFEVGGRCSFTRTSSPQSAQAWHKGWEQEHGPNGTVPVQGHLSLGES